jgi:hypothetical protein
MPSAAALILAGLLMACTAEAPPSASREAVEAAVDHAQLQADGPPGSGPARDAGGSK